MLYYVFWSQAEYGIVCFIPLRYYSRTWLYRPLKGNRNQFDTAGVRYIQTFIKSRQIRSKENEIYIYIYSRGSLYPVFHIAKPYGYDANISTWNNTTILNSFSRSYSGHKALFS